MGFNDINRPSAIYDTNKTFVTYQNEDFDIYAIECNHTTGWSYPVKVGDGINVPLSTPDTHGAPSINIDSQGYLHIFGASHNSQMKHWKSDNTRDTSAWTQQASLGTSATYPLTDYFKGKLYLFYREGTTTNADWVYSNEDDFTSTTILINNGSNSAYMGGVFNDGTYLYAVWTWYSSTDGYRDDPSFGKFDGTKWYKADNTEITLPFTQVNQDLIFSSGGKFANVYDIKVDTNGVIYVLVPLSPTSSHLGVGNFKCAVYSGSWASYNIAAINNTFDNGSFDIINTTTLDAYITVDGLDDGTEKTRGGIVKRYRSTDNGQNWALQETISGTSAQSSAPYVIHSYNSDLKVVWAYGDVSPTYVDGYPTDVGVPLNAILSNCILSNAKFAQ